MQPSQSKQRTRRITRFWYLFLFFLFFFTGFVCLVAFIVTVRFEILAGSGLGFIVLTCFEFNAVLGVNGLHIFLKDLRDDFNLLTLTSFLSLGKGKDLMLGDMTGDSDGDLRGSIFTIGVFNNDVPSTGFYNRSTCVKIINTILILRFRCEYP